MTARVVAEPAVGPAGAEEIDSLIDLHDASFAGKTNFSRLLGRDFLRATYGWFFGAEDRFVLVARESGRLAGVLVGTYGCTLDGMQSARKRAMLSRLLRRPHLLLSKEIRQPILDRLLYSGRPDESNYFDRPDFAFIYIIAAHPDFQGCGIAGQMVQALEARVRAKGLSVIYVTVGEHNDHSLRAFAKAGFVQLAGVLTDGNVMLRKEIAQAPA